MFKGTPAIPPGRFSKIVQSMGGNDNAFTSWDFTAFHQTVPKEKLADVMKMEAERMNDLTPRLDDIYAERQVVIEERRQNTDSSPDAMLGERMRNVLFPNHPYGRPVIGWMQEMLGLKWVDCLAFYKKWYAPNNAVLVISGDVTLADVLPLAEATYGRLPRENVPVRARTISPRMQGEVLVTFSRDDVRQPVWEKMIRVPSAHQNRNASLSLELLEDLLGGATGRLYQTLVVGKKIATSIGVSYSPYAWDDATLTVYGTPADGVTFNQLAGAVDDVLKRTAEKGFTEAEIKTSVTRMQDQAVYARDSLTGPAMNVGYARAIGVSLEDVETWPSRLEALTAADATKALSDYVIGQNGVTGLLLPKGGKE
jgi:zinc protease